MRKTKENGITLIALIITIIVMLILVGVTVSVALNGGLFETAQDAANRTQIEADREVLQAAIVGALDENLVIPNAEKLRTNLPNGWNVTGEENYKATSPSGNEFIVYNDGTIKEAATVNLTALEKYFLGEFGEGKDLNSLLDPNLWNESFLDDPNTEEKENETIIQIGGIEVSDNLGGLYIKHDDKAYRVNAVIDYSNEVCLTKSVELVYEPKEREGEIVKYDSNNDGKQENWMILYNNEDNMEIISMEVMGSLTLGCTDEKTQGDTDLEKAMYSYNNAITRLNDYCESLVANPNKISVRCAGSNPIDSLDNDATMYASDELEQWADGKYNNVMKGSDTNCEQDVVRMGYYLFGTDSYPERTCWMASRIVGKMRSDDYSSIESIYFRIREGFGSSFDPYYFGQFGVDKDGAYCGGNREYTKGGTFGVRPVVKVSSDQI